ncbi:MAG: MOFRL family protein [Bdellovibrionales bacterium]
MVSLIVNDTPDTTARSVGSGPTFNSTFDADRLKKILSQCNPAVSDKLRFWFNETLNSAVDQQKESSHCDNWIIADSSRLLEKARQHFQNLQFSAVHHGPFEVGVNWHIQQLDQLQSGKFMLSTGEYHLAVDGPGLGGRNTHFVLEMADQIFFKNVLSWSSDKLKQVTILSVGTDGTDGPTDAAGACFNYDLFTQSLSQGISPEGALKSFDSYRFFEKMGGLIKTGPGPINLMDIRAICL